MTDNQQAATPSEMKFSVPNDPLTWNVPGHSVFTFASIGDATKAAGYFNLLLASLTERTEQLAHYKAMHDLGWAKQDCPSCGAQMAGSDAYQAWQKRAETAEVEVARLNGLVQRCRPSVAYCASITGYVKPRLEALLNEIDQTGRKE